MVQTGKPYRPRRTKQIYYLQSFIKKTFTVRLDQSEVGTIV